MTIFSGASFVNMRNLGYIVLLFFITTGYGSSTNQNTAVDWIQLKTQFQKQYKELNIPALEIGYVQNLQAIANLDDISRQLQFFLMIQQKLETIDRNTIPAEGKVDYEIIRYETALNLERINLEYQSLQLAVDSISKDGLSSIQNGKAWYAYFLKRWVDIEVTPDQMYQFGLQQIERAALRIKEIQQASGMDSSNFQKHINQDAFFYDNVEDIQQAFELTKIRVADGLEAYFPDLEKVPDISIERGKNRALANVPAYYNNNTFYFNYFDKPFNKRQVSWIYIHEALPGHHYQLRQDGFRPRTNIAVMFQYYGYIEGYAAYVEEIGYEINAYQNIYDELGKWEWDIIRSVRVALDVGLNYYAWSDEQALLFWQKHITGKDDIAQREITRMKNWPAQVITYKYGADKILKWKETYQTKAGFKLKEFHEIILKYGSIPMSILEKTLNLPPIPVAIGLTKQTSNSPQA